MTSKIDSLMYMLTIYLYLFEDAISGNPVALAGAQLDASRLRQREH
jgi:hypothetical protein